MISLTESAVKEITTIQEREKKHGYGLRVRVIGGGCSGLQYQMGLEEAPVEDDKVVESFGMKVFVDQKSAAFLAGTQIDFVHDLNGSGFKVQNPNAESTCGCGKSFS
ncbi:MAG: iron-sulfur cluster assembly accessory protein [Deltaproteobacteria bacterium]|nr:iron-sulfur cluster assembly accessory protein [Deltaproteobacteria bacterium]